MKNVNEHIEHSANSSFCKMFSLSQVKFSPYYILTFIYFLSYGLMLFYDGLSTDGVWWMSNLFKEEGYAGQAKFWNAHGSPLVPMLYYGLYIVVGTNCIYWATFFSYLLIGFIFYRLLIRLDFVTKNEALVISALVLTFPCNTERLVGFFAHYSINFLLFMVAFSIMNSKNIALRIVSLFLFILSFFTASLLVFYVVPMAYWIYMDKKNWLKARVIDSIKNLTNWCLSKLDFFILPFLFFYVKNALMKRIFYINDYYIADYPLQDYHIISFKSLFTSIPKTFFAFYSGFIEVIDRAIFEDLSSLWFLPLVFVFFKFFTFKVEPGKKLVGFLLILGCLLFYIGAYPYFVVNSLLNTVGGNSHHQLLICFGAGFMLFYGVKYILKNSMPKYHTIVFSSALALFINSNINNTINFAISVTKDNVIIEKIKEIKEIKEIKAGNKQEIIIKFYDNTEKFNMYEDKTKETSLRGWLLSAFNNKQLYGVIHGDENLWRMINSSEYSHEYLYLGNIRIDTDVSKLSILDKLRLIFYYKINTEKFYNFVDGIGFIKLSYDPYEKNATADKVKNFVK